MDQLHHFIGRKNTPHQSERDENADFNDFANSGAIAETADVKWGKIGNDEC